MARWVLRRLGGEHQCCRPFELIPADFIGLQFVGSGVRRFPYKDFEDQRSGETLGKLQKVKSDTERFVHLFISLIFQSIIGIVFVFVYAMNIHPLLGSLYLATVPIIASISSFLGKKIKVISKQILGETTAIGRCYNRIPT